jgi:hypothetical protein
VAQEIAVEWTNKGQNAAAKSVSWTVGGGRTAPSLDIWMPGVTSGALPSGGSR